ncbi:MAG TPA: GSCFA domain-containing protein [Rhodocyclaceae bacterium]
MHPYKNLPAKAFWRQFVSNTGWRELQLNSEPKFRLQASDRIATAGSCFAQHLTRYLKKSGIAPYVAETAHPLIAAYGGDVASYSQFSARYGNVYTTRQCLELFRQAFGLMPVIDDFVEEGGRCYDLVRPNILKEGFASLAEARADRAAHIACVRRMFETADVFIFTLGLTESWYHADKGHTYPVCPGTVHGEYQPEQHRFRNLSCAEVIEDLDCLISGLKAANPNLKIILTVSPVPLVATKTEKNVLVASQYSKSVLRAACGEVEARYEHVSYFPSFEIISHPASFGQYLESDLRGVTERGVSHVMGSFFASFYGELPQLPALEAAPVAAPSSELDVAKLLAVECEELFNEVIQ